MRAHPNLQPIRAVVVPLLYLALAGCEASGPSSPANTDLTALQEELRLSVRLEPRVAAAGDTVDVVATLGNPTSEPLTLRGPAACIVSWIGVRNAPWDEPVMFEGGGEQACADDATLTVGASDSASVRVPLVVWQVPDPARPETLDEASVIFPSGHGPPLPDNFWVVVRSDPLGAREVSADRTLYVLRSGWHRGASDACDVPLADTHHVMDDPHVVARPDPISEGRLRVRFEIHAASPLMLRQCNWAVVAALDRDTPDGWDLGSEPRFCSDGNGTGALGVSAGGCVRGVLYRNYEPGSHRLRIWIDGTFLATGPFPA